MGEDRWTSTSMPYLAPRAAGQADAWTEEATASGRRGGQRIVSAGEVAAPAEVADLLGLSEGDAVVVRRRLIDLDGEPCELTDTYYPYDLAAGTPQRPPVRSGTWRALCRVPYVAVRTA